MTQLDRYHTAVVAGNLTGQEKSNFDSQGRIYKNETYAVDPSTGTIGNALVNQSWLDASGNVIKQQAVGSEAFTKTVYDGFNRQSITYLAYNTGTSSKNNDVSAYVVGVQQENTYDAASNVIENASYQRFHDATGNAALNGPNATQPKARASYTATWPDAFGRARVNANYGTHGGADITRPETATEPSDTLLLTRNDYSMENQGTQSAIDPAGVETKQFNDQAGRRIKLIENYTGKPAIKDNCKKNTDCICYHHKRLGGIDSELVNHFGKPDAGEPHVRFDEGDGSKSELSLLYKSLCSFKHQS